MSRRWKILPRKILREIQLWGVEPGFLPMLHIIFPDVGIQDARRIMKPYYCAKIADDLNDFRDDVYFGFLNIPQQDVHNLKGLEIKNNTFIPP